MRPRRQQVVNRHLIRRPKRQARQQHKHQNLSHPKYSITAIARRGDFPNVRGRFLWSGAFLRASAPLRDIFFFRPRSETQGGILSPLPVITIGGVPATVRSEEHTSELQ